MKKLPRLLVLGLLLLSCACSRSGYRIVGDIFDLDETDINLLDVYGHTIGTAPVKDGKFVLEGSVDVPCLAYLNNGLGVNYPIDIPVLLENAKIRVKGDATRAHVDITGTKANENMVRYREKRDHIAPDDVNSYVLLLRETYEENIDNVLGSLMIHNMYGLVTDAELVDYCDRLPEPFRSEPTVTHYRDICAARLATAVGHPYVDFSVPGPDGTLHRLSDAVAANSATVLVFWASWSRAAASILPELAQRCKPYASRGLKMFTVSLDSNESAWQKSVADFGLFGDNFCPGPNEADQLLSLYGIDGMPRYLLLDGDGRILVRSDRPADIREPLEDLFK